MVWMNNRCSHSESCSGSTKEKRRTEKTLLIGTSESGINER